MEMFYRSVTFEEAKELLDGDSQCLILDVREEEEYLAGHAKNAVLFPLNDITSVTARNTIPSKEIPLLLYCRSGKRSKLAAQILIDLGYKRIYDMGGLTGWPYGLTYGLE